MRSEKLTDGLSRDKRRLVLGLWFMALLLATTLVAVFLLGTTDGRRMAPGVPFLVGSGWVLVLGAAVTFYRSYSGEPDEREGDGPRVPGDPRRPASSGGRAAAGEQSAPARPDEPS